MEEKKKERKTRKERGGKRSQMRKAIKKCFLIHAVPGSGGCTKASPKGLCHLEFKSQNGTNLELSRGI